MKKILSSSKTAIVLLIVTVLSLGFYAYMLLRPISYGMGYQNVTEYDGETFKGIIEFHIDKTMTNCNTNFDEEMESRYYYKDGYVFFTVSKTDEAYEREVKHINDNFDEAIKTPFYADKINAFKLVATESDGYSTVYTCKPAIVFAIVVGIVELALVSLTALSFVLRKKNDDTEDEGSV